MEDASTYQLRWRRRGLFTNLLKRQKTFQQTFLNLINGVKYRLTQEPWSSGYGRRLMFQSREFESQQYILDGHFFTYLFVVKFVMCVWKDENKLKRGRGWPIFKKVLFNVRRVKFVSNLLQRKRRYSFLNWLNKIYRWKGV